MFLAHLIDANLAAMTDFVEAGERVFPVRSAHDCQQLTGRSGGRSIMGSALLADGLFSAVAANDLAWPRKVD
ncbi:MAG: hypothetical protein MK108_05295 [Mariniblastus sp.]|nr:hypothetical protein [Mariniblastus sp.]